MDRLVTVILLAALASGPSARWFCERACGAERPSAATVEDCHRSAEPAPAEPARNGGPPVFGGAMHDAQPAPPAGTVVGNHDCRGHASHAALVTKRAHAWSDSFVPERAPSGSGAGAAVAVARVPRSNSANSSPPHPGFLVPLRL
jgi:hypothetical protein